MRSVRVAWTGSPGRLPEDITASAQPVSTSDPVGHLLSRTTYGPRAEELRRARAIGYEAWVEEQLHPETIDDAACDARLAAECPHLALTPAQLRRLFRSEPGNGPDLRAELVHATLLRRFLSKRQLFESLVEFWSDHFSIYHWDDYQDFLKLPDDRDVVRRHALGRFPRLLQASGHSPAMLAYLDNDPSSGEAPNENYARELLELHAIGVNGGYGEADVTALAHALTGFSFDWDWDSPRFGQFVFRAEYHDQRSKTVLGVPLPARNGRQDGETMLRFLGNHPSAATFVATKLCRRFAADQPPPALVTRVAATLSATRGDIRAAMRTLLLAPEFLDTRGLKMRRPMDVALAAVRLLDARVEPAAFREEFRWFGWEAGHLPFDWAPPNGYPDVARYWAHSTGLVRRWNLASSIAFNWSRRIEVDHRALVGDLLGRWPATARGLAEGVATRLLRRALGAAELEPFVEYAARGGAADQRLERTELERRSPGVVALTLASPQFQMR